MVRIFKAQVHGLNAVQPHIWGDNKAVYYIKLGRLILSRVVGPVQQAAGGGGAVIGPDAVLRQEAVIQAAGYPELGVNVGIIFEAAGKNLVKVPAGDDIVAFFIFTLYEIPSCFVWAILPSPSS